MFTRRRLRVKVSSALESQAFSYSKDEEDVLNQMTDSQPYPHNHLYSIDAGTLVAREKLSRRFSSIKNFYPQPLESFLDIGCARGFFAIEAAVRSEHPRVVGVDISAEYIEFCQRVKSYLHVPNVHFRKQFLHETVQDLDEIGGPFQMVLLLNTYHYLFYGSGGESFAYFDHRKIFCFLRKLCSGLLLFTAPLELKHCPGVIRRSALAHGKTNYSRAEILSAASEFFEIETITASGRRPFFVMRPLPGKSPD